MTKLQLLYEAMKKKEIVKNKKDFADKLNITYSNLTRYLDGTINLSIDDRNYRNFMAAGINLDWFLCGEGEMFSAVQSPGDTVRVPLLSQRISCGPGQRWNSENNIIEYISIDTLAPRFEGRKIYGMRAKGTSMIGVGIEDGDVVLFSTNSDLPQTDGNYVFGLDGDVFCKRLEFDELSRKIKVYSVRKKGLEYAELVQTLCIDDSDFSERFVIFGKVFAWIHQV